MVAAPLRIERKMYYRSIQSLRAVAALLVMAHHLTSGKFLLGAAGVDIFFIISGFIMGANNSDSSAKLFILKRLIRVTPLYWLLTFAMCGLSLTNSLTNFKFDSASLLKSLFFIPYSDQFGNTWPLVIPGWTLNMEVFFYFIFAFGLIFRSSQLFVALILLALVLAGQFFDPGNIAWSFWTMPILLEFVGGLVLADLIRPASGKLGLAILFAGAAAFLLVGTMWHYSDALRPVAWGMPAFLLVCGALTIERAGVWPKAVLKPLERIGDASYSLYLTHGIVISALHRKLGMGLPISVISGPLCLAVAFATFYGFEKPVGRALGKLVRGDRAKSGMLVRPH